MECIINIIKFLDKHNGFIMCFLTFGIMILAAVTAYIANQKRKDDLFKLRLEVYNEIVIKFKEKYLEATKQHSIEEELYYQMEESEFLGNTGLSKKQYKEIINNNLISKIRWLFDDEIADLIKNLLINDLDENNKFFHVTLNIEDLGTFCVTEEFTKLFDKYLKLDNQFLKRFFRWKK
jgi:hypothetical protein